MLAAAGLTIAALLLCAALFAGGRYEQELAGARSQIATLDVLLAEETVRSLQSVRLVLGSVEELLRAGGELTAGTLVDRASVRATHDDLRLRVLGVPQIDALTIIGADGRLLNFSRSWPIPSVNVADRDYFKALSRPGGGDWFVSEPVPNRSSGTWTIYLAHRLGSANGGFAGLALAAIELAHFERLYRSLGLDPSFFITLWRTDGVLLARYPAAEPGQHTRHDAIAPSDEQDGVFEGALSIDGSSPTTKIIASRRTAEFPLRVNVGRLKASALEQWRREMVYLAVATTLGILVLATLAWVLIRQFAAFEAAASALREQAAAQEARERAEAALHQVQKLESIGQLSGGIAHDFNNLLTVVGSSVELLRKPGLSDERRTRYLNAITETVRRGSDLTGRLLAYARQQPLQPVAFDVRKNVAEMSGILERLTGSGVTVEVQVPDRPCFASADPGQFDNALMNMGVNARDAMDGQGRLRIWVDAVDTVPPTAEQAGLVGPFVAVSVSDTGTGIAADQLGRIFEPFFTTKALGKGTGLGLSQVFGFARQSGGDVLVDSEVGRGTTFTLYLPRADPVAA